MAEFYAGGIYYTIKVDDQSGVGVDSAKKKIKSFGTETTRTDGTLKSLSRDSSILGGSLAALGGTAMVAGTAIGGPFGQSLQVAGAGVAILGSGVVTLVPALRTLAVVTTGQVIPALIGLGTAMYAALGPIGLAALAIGGIVAAYAALKLTAPENQFKTITRSIEDNKTAMVGLNKEYHEFLDLQKELAGIPEEIEDIDRDIRGLGLDIKDVNEEIGKRPKELVSARTELGLSALTAQESYQKAVQGGDALQIATTKQALTKALQLVAENEAKIAGEDPELARLLYRQEVLIDRLEEFQAKRAEIVSRGETLPGLISKEAGAVGMAGIALGATPYKGEMVQLTPNLQPGAGMGVTGSRTPIQINNYITVSDPAQVKKITEDSLTLADRTAAQGYSW